MRRGLWFLIALLSGEASSQALPDTTEWISGRLPHFRTLTVGDGLSQSSVVDVAQDHTGYWWLATQDGLNRYDGRHITYYEKYFDDLTRPGFSRLGKLFVDRRGDLWLIPVSGIPERRDSRTGRFTAFPYLKFSSCIGQDRQGRYWAGTYANQIVHFDPARGLIARYPIPGTVYDLIQTSQGRMWLSASSGLYSFDEKRHHWARAPVQGTTPSFSCLTEHADGTLWAGTHSRGLYRKLPSDSTFQPFTSFNGRRELASDLYILSLMTDRRQRVWVGTYGQGVYQLDASRQRIDQFRASRTQANALAYDDILDIFEDRTGVIGVSTDGGGISFYDPSLIRFAGFTASQVPPDIEVAQIRAICTDQKQTVWLGTSGKGLTSYTQTDRWTTYRASPGNPNSLPSDRIMSLLNNPDGSLWIGTQGGGLAWFNPASGRFKNYSISSGFPDHTVWSLFRDRAGRTWAGTQTAGLLQMNEQGRVVARYAGACLGGSPVKAIAEGPMGQLWIGTEGGGFCELNLKTRVCRRFRAKVGARRNDIKCFYSDPKTRLLWVGTQGGGLLRCDVRTGTYRTFTTRNGLPNNVIYGILPDQEGKLWVSTNRGLCRIKVEGGKRKGGSTIDQFTPDDGLQSMEFNTGASYHSPDGTLFFGGVAGFNVFRPSKLVESTLAPKVAITSIEINGQPFLSDTLPESRGSLSLRYNQNTLAFTVAGLHFSLPTRNRFRFKLEGYDTQWTDADTRNYIRYTNLPANHYLLRVQAANYDGVWSTDEARLGLEINAPFWQRWWFVMAIIILIFSMLYVFYRYRINQLLRIQGIRNRLSADLHDEIGSSLSSISILGILAGNQLDAQHPARAFVSRITEESRLISRSMSDIVWSINPRNDDLESLLSRMNRFGAELLEAKHIAYDVTILPPDELQRIRLTMEQRRDLYLIFKEAINNLIKYAQCTQVAIHIEVQKNRFNLMIRDNGVGFDPDTKATGNGLYNMQQRAQNMRGTLRIASAPGTGTTLKLSFPLNKITSKGYWL